MDQSDLQESKLGAQMHDMLAKGQHYAAQLGARTQQSLRERPLIAVLGALALGVVVGAVLGRQINKH